MKKDDLRNFPKLVSNISNWQEYTFYKGERSKRPLQFTTRPHRIRFSVSQSQYWVFREIFVEDFYDIRSLVRSLPADPVVVDIGANSGFFDILLLSKIPHARVYAFEPVPTNCRLIETTMSRNPQLKRGLKLFNWAVTGDGAEHIELFTESTGDNSEIASIFSKFDARNTRSLTVAAQSLTSVISKNGLTRIDLLKMDCEGSEFDILYQTPSDVLRVIDKMVIEVHHIDDEQYNLAALSRYLEGAGYRTADRQITPATFYLEATKV